MALLKNDDIVADGWTRAGDDEAIGDGILPIVSLSRWQRDREELIGRNTGIGIVLKSDEPPELIADDIGRFGVICLDFPKFTDGRGYSHARLLRSRYGFTGEIRAVGNVLRDQALFMRRCGIDGFEIADDSPVESWRRAFRELSVRYQPAEDREPPDIAEPRMRPYLKETAIGSRLH